MRLGFLVVQYLGFFRVYHAVSEANQLARGRLLRPQLIHSPGRGAVHGGPSAVPDISASGWRGQATTSLILTGRNIGSQTLAGRNQLTRTYRIVPLARTVSCTMCGVPRASVCVPGDSTPLRVRRGQRPSAM